MVAQQVTASYQMFRYYRFQILGMFALFAVIGVVLVAAAAGGAISLHPLWFVVSWLVGVVVLGYFALLRFCYRLELADGVVHWYAPLRSGWVSVAEVRGARPLFNHSSRWSSFVEVIDLADHRPLLVLVFNRLGRQRYGQSYDPYEYANRDDVAWFLYQLEKLTPDAPMRME
ncbi:MAG TPA: hypothetical protein VHX15_11890 [Frankiaceae bacterium]|jgi:hypothetical protein|nr:hypothetical protein [Frankiaceae bacterium]